MAKNLCPVCQKPCEGEACFRHKLKKALSKGTSRLKPRKKSEQEKQESQREKEKMWKLFQEVYDERGPFSQIDGTYLGAELRSYMVDHLLPKSKYPELKYEKENLYLVTLDQHSSKEAGYPLPAHQLAINRAKERFGIL